MITPLFLNEGGQMDHFGNWINTWFVDFRRPDDRTLIGTLIKGCEEKFAIETNKQIRVSTPSCFRQHGESLIRDPAETYPSEEQLIAEVVDDPVALGRARRRDTAANRAAELSGTKHETHTKSIVQRSLTSRALKAGKNCWIFCTSLEPSSQKEWDLWRTALDPNYDHVTNIYSARDFARALAGALIEQMGPQSGSGASTTHSFEGETTVKTSHNSQLICHGPVIYVDDIYRLVTQVSSPIQRALLPLFAKDPRFKDQREYRYVIFGDKEPEKPILDLNATTAVLATMDAQTRIRGPMAVPEVESIDGVGQELAQQDNTMEDLGDFSLEEALIELNADPSSRTKPWEIGHENLPDDLQEKTATYAAVVALGQKVASFVKWASEDPHQTQAIAGAAWFAEKLIRQLCQQFTEPIKGISASPDNFIVIDFALPHWKDIGGKLAVAPSGQCAVTLKKGNQPYTFFYLHWEGAPIPDHALQSLKDFVDPYLRKGRNGKSTM